jgi:hypothetical protein
LVAQNELTEWTPDGHLRHSASSAPLVSLTERFNDWAILERFDVSRILETWKFKFVSETQS